MPTINAFAVMQPGGPVTPYSYHRALGPTDLLVRITHCSVARGDVQFMDNEWGDTRYPLIAGHEIVGIVVATGPAVAELRAGDRVGVGYQQSACFACEACLDGDEQLCPDQKVIAVDCFGGLADAIVVDHRFAFALPSTLASASAAPLLSAGLTVYSAITRALLRDGAEVAVLGIGGLGYLAIQFLRAMGHRVAAFSLSPSKQALVEQLGAEYIDSGGTTHQPTLTRRFDLMLSTLNTPFDLDAHLAMLKPRGRLCVVAQPLQPLPIRMGLLYDNALRSIHGSYVGSRRDMTAMLTFAAERDVTSLVNVMPFDDLSHAIELVRTSNPIGRVVLQRSL